MTTSTVTPTGASAAGPAAVRPTRTRGAAASALPKRRLTAARRTAWRGCHSWSARADQKCGCRVEKDA
eukprot:scaffold58898_cov33-Phaeocystis_antarctica.AAC.1